MEGHAQKHELLISEHMRRLNLAKFLKKKPRVPLTSRIRTAKQNKKKGGRGLYQMIQEDFHTNWRSGFTVSLVNIPLSISLAIASGSSPVAGIVAAFWGGFLAAVFGGSEFNIVGPTGALSGLLMAVSNIFGPSVLPFVALVSGWLIFLVWYFNMADYMLFIPSSVIHGFTFGVGLIIALGQIDFAFGLTFKHMEPEFFEKVFESLAQLGNANPNAVILFTAQFVLLLMLAKKWRTVPWEIVMAIIGICLAYACDFVLTADFGISFITLRQKYGDLTLNLFSLPAFQANFVDPKVITTCVGVSFIAILETLISARMADGMTQTDHDRDKEVLGVALANLGCGIFGGIPATAALARTALNISAGATSRVSAIIGQFVLLVISLIMLPYFLMMPLPTVAAILCKVAVRLMDVTHMTHMLAFDRAMFWIAVFTAGASFFLDTTVGLAGGSLISLLLYAKQMSSGQCEVLIYKNRDQIGELDTTKMDDFKYTTTEDLVIEDEEDEAVGADDKAIPLISLGDGAWETKTNFDKCQKANLMVYQLFGKLNYINDRSHVGRAKKLAAMAPECKYVVFCFKALTQIDLDGVASFGEMVTNFERANIQVGVAEILNAQVLDALNEQKYFEEVKAKGLIFDTLEIAVQKLSTKLEAEGL